MTHPDSSGLPDHPESIGLSYFTASHGRRWRPRADVDSGGWEMNPRARLVLVLAWLYAPACSPSARGVLSIAHPSAGETLHYAAGSRSLNVSLQYEYELVALPTAPLRVCIELQRAQAAHDFAWFAEGCFETTQPITLLLPSSPATFRIHAALADDSIDPLARTTVDFTVAPVPPFEPAYGWRPVPPGAGVPAGLDVRMHLSGEGSEAKIPEPFRLQLSLDAPVQGIFRHDVHRHTTVHQLLDALDEFAKKRRERHPSESATPFCSELLLASGDGAHPHGAHASAASGGSDVDAAWIPLLEAATAEELELFTLQERLRVRWHACAPSSGGTSIAAHSQAHPHQMPVEL